MIEVTLTAIANGDTYTFLINPTETSEDHSGDYSSLPVLQTGQPLVRYRSSQSTYSFPDVVFYTSGSQRDIREYLDRLRNWTKPQGSGKDPQVLKLTWGTWVIERCYLSKLAYRVTQRREGRPTEARGSIELLLAPEVPKPILVDTQVKIELTPREQAQQTKKVQDTLKADKNLAKRLKVSPKDTLEVTQDSRVIVKDAKGKPRVIGKLSDVLGSKTSPGLRYYG